MKLTVLIVIFLVGCLTAGQAQVSEETRAMALGNHPSLSIEIPDVTAKFVESEWKDFMKDYGRVKNVRRADETVVSAAQVLSIGGASTLDIYARTEEAGSGVRQILWIDMGDSFVNADSNNDAYNGTVDLLKDFAHHVKMKQVELEVEDVEKALSKLESNLEKLLKSNEGYYKDIEQAKERILQAEQNIVKNLEEQEIAKQEIASQQQVVEEVKERLNKVRSQRDN